MKIDMLKSATAPAVGDRISGQPKDRTFQATVSGTGAVTASVVIEASNDANGWLSAGTITLSGTDLASDGFPSTTMWSHVRARLVSVTGVGAKVDVTMGVFVNGY